jgi:UDP-2,4-diacetamido-2,4,6-trideoxy-beta-L-altropyranose hydrolase
MKVVFRTDASLQIGSGHVMRCLTLADALTAQGAECQFISRAHPGHLLDLTRQRGYTAHSLDMSEQQAQAATSPTLAHAAWLGCDWQTDAAQTGTTLASLQPDWLVVDHYALDQHWESFLKSHYKKLMVIDDLADRAHLCDLLLDQNWFDEITPTRYHKLVPPHCHCYLGPAYALLKPEYAQLRASMPPRDGTVSRVLVFMGGSDPTNQTAKVLTVLIQPNFAHLRVDVVLGQNHPDAEGFAIETVARPNITLHQGLPTLAPLMARADVMIGAGGSTTWERMCLGLPAIVISVAANQTTTNLALMNAGYIDFLGEIKDVNTTNIAEALQRCLDDPGALKAQSGLGQKMVTGDGASMICQQLLKSCRA